MKHLGGGECRENALQPWSEEEGQLYWTVFPSLSGTHLF